MSVRYNFESIDDLADYAKYLAEQADKLAKTAKTQRDRNAYEHEASAYRYMEQVILTSNLIDGRLILVDEDLEDAKLEIEQAIGSITTIREYLGQTLSELNKKLTEITE